MATHDDQQFNRLDDGFAQFLSQRCRLDDDRKPRFKTLLRLLSARQAGGHSCMTLAAEDVAVIESSGLSTNGDQIMPLVIENNRLYLHRYWLYEKRLAEQLAALCKHPSNIQANAETLNRYFPSQDGEIDWQKQAAECAAARALTIITGGPGTGKTTTVVKILALLQELAERPLHIALAAPTGKAAMRLEESIAKNKSDLPCSPSIKNRIPEQVATLHRLLGPRPPSPYFKHSSDNPLPYDVVMIDETSMVDLALMSKLVDALKPGARLILLGDKDQLASVESGAVLADLTLGLPRQTVELLKTHRFQGGIKALADAVNQQAAEQAWQLLLKASTDVSLLTEEPIDFIVDHYLGYLELMTDGADVQTVFTAFDRFRVLCSNQRGPNSVCDINAKVEHALSRLDKIRLTGLWYHGRPVMITANNPALRLYNGDIGLCMRDAESDGQLRVFFKRGDGSVKKFQPARLLACETVYAMTIHKSQGSEFEKILIMLPERMNPVLSKELLYTAITRAKNHVTLAASQSLFIATVNQTVQRDSGLAEKLRALTPDFEQP